MKEAVGKQSERAASRLSRLPIRAPDSQPGGLGGGVNYAAFMKALWPVTFKGLLLVSLGR